MSASWIIIRILSLLFLYKGRYIPIAHFLRLAPRQIGGEQRIVLVQLFAVVLAGTLFRTVFGVGCKHGRKRHESLLEVVDA
jgi:hypothetical protein